jgi:hypothetical protein
MKISVFVKPRSKKPGVEKGPGGSYVVRVADPPAEGRANEAVLRALAEHFGVAPSALRLVHGGRGRRKLVEVNMKKPTP